MEEKGKEGGGVRKERAREEIIRYSHTRLREYFYVCAYRIISIPSHRYHSQGLSLIHIHFADGTEGGLVGVWICGLPAYNHIHLVCVGGVERKVGEREM